MPNNESPFSMEEIMKIAASPAGQQLVHLLQHNGSEDVQQAVKQAASGDFGSAREVISGLLQDPQVRALLEKLGR